MNLPGMPYKVRGPSQEFRVRHPDTGEMITLVREESMTGPPLWALAAIFVFATAWYAFWYGVATWSLARWIGWELVTASLPLALLATIRIAARLRENSAVESGWPSPVMRQRAAVLLPLVLLSVALGAWSGLLFNHIPVIAAVGVDDLIVTTAAAAWSAIAMLRKIPKLAPSQAEG